MDTSNLAKGDRVVLNRTRHLTVKFVSRTARELDSGIVIEPFAFVTFDDADYSVAIDLAVMQGALFAYA